MASTTQTPPSRPPLISVALISAASLSYEVLLIHLLSIIQWHHFAYMVISLALLGFGASGTVLALFRHAMLTQFLNLYPMLLSFFGFSILICFLLAQQIPFNPEEILWDAWQPWYLVSLYLLLAVPFLFAAGAIGLVLMHYTGQISRVYAVDLIGAGFGGLGLVLILWWLFSVQALMLVSMLAFVASVVAVFELRVANRIGSLVVLVTFILGVAIILNGISLVMSPYKGLSQALRIQGAQIINEQTSPLGLISVVESPVIPLRHAPGLSLNASTEPPLQIGLFVNGDAMTAVLNYTGDLKELDYLDQLTSALPYHIGKPENVLILGAGGGTKVLQALGAGVERIDAVELNPKVVDLVRNTYKDFSGAIYDDKRVKVHVDEIRRFMAKISEHYDLIQVPLLGSSSSSAAGLHALSANHVYTVEAVQSYLQHLSTDGYLALTHWIKLPPRDTLKSLATVIEALRDLGVTDPESRVVLIRGWQTSTLLVKNGLFNQYEIQALKRFAKARSFDVAYYPNIAESETNRYNILTEPYYYEAAKKLFGSQASELYRQYKFNIIPATDDRPYFFHFYKWSGISESLSLLEKGGVSLIDWGFLVLLATLIQATVIGFILVVLPLWFLRHGQWFRTSRIKAPRALLYFVLVGLGFMFVEIAFIQKFILFLHHPLYAVSVVLTAFLVFAGLGSGWSSQLKQEGHQRRNAGWAVVGIVCFTSLNMVVTSVFSVQLSSISEVVKILVTITLIAPQAFFMGIPFPSALRVVADNAPSLVPWAWGVNGCVSVVSAILATLLAIQFGFTVLVIISVVLYVLAGWLFPVVKDRDGCI